MDEPRPTTHNIRTSNYSFTRLVKAPLGRVIKQIEKHHGGAEASVLSELMHLSEAYRDYFKEWIKEMDLQRMAAEKLWQVMKDYCVLRENSCKPPTPHCLDMDDVVLNKYHIHYHIILASNFAMLRGISSIRQNLLTFRRECSKLDLTEETVFNLGDAFHKPIRFFMDLAEELFNYFYSTYLKLDCRARLLDPMDMGALDEYRDALKPCEEFEDYLLHNLSYCYCLRPSQPCPERRRVPPESTDIGEAMKRAQLSRCAQRRAKMSQNRDPSVPKIVSVTSTTHNLEHELRMNQLSMRLAHLRGSTSQTRHMERERTLVEQMIYALSPSLVPTTYRPPTPNFS